MKENIVPEINSYKHKIIKWILKDIKENNNRYNSSLFMGLSGIAWTFSELGEHEKAISILDLKYLKANIMVFQENNYIDYLMIILQVQVGYFSY